MVYNMKSLAICIISYNVENYIKSLVETILGFEKFDSKLMKIYVYDDQSTDETKKILKDFQDKKLLTMIEGTENKGPCVARLELMNYVNEDFIIFVDSDDTLSENVFETYLNFCDSYDLIILKRWFVYNDKKNFYQKSYHIQKKYSKLQNYLGNTFLTYITGVFMSYRIYKNSIFKCFPKTRIDLFEDMLIYSLVIYFAKNPIYVDAFYYYNRNNEKSLLSSADKLKQYQEAKKCLDFFNKLISIIPTNDEINYVKNVVNLRLIFTMYKWRRLTINREFNFYKNKYLDKKTIKKSLLSKNDRFTYYVIFNWFVGQFYSKIYLLKFIFVKI